MKNMTFLDLCLELSDNTQRF